MPTFPDQSGDPVQQLAAELQAVRDELRELRARGFHPPILDADPDAADPTRLWLLEDGRLRSRTEDGIVHEYPDIAQLRPPVPTFAADPSPSSGWRLWFRGSDGALRGRLANGNIVTYTPSTGGSSGDGGTGAAGGSSSTKPKPADDPPKRRTKVYPATWGRTFCATHGVETGGRLRYGTFAGSAHGERRIMLGFDDAQIRSDLAGGVIRRVELHLLNTDAWAYSGITIVFGAHNKSGAQGSYSATRSKVWRGHWPHTGDGQFWRRIPDWYGNQLRNGNIRGLTVDQPSAAASFYGELDWSSVRLRITYTS